MICVKPRNKKIKALAKIEAKIAETVITYLLKEGFVQVFPPHITRFTGTCENIDTVFEISYFEKYAILAQTEQLFLECLVPTLQKVWCFGPSFRAEPKVDERHLTEFTLIEMEFAGDLNELIKRIESMFRNIIRSVIQNMKKELDTFNVDINRLKRVRIPFKRIGYEDAVNLLSLEWGNDLESKHEMHLVEFCDGQPLFVVHHPEEIKFFNMKTNLRNPKVVNSVDLILPFCGEAFGGAEREYKYKNVLEKLKRSSMLKQIRKRGWDINDFQWYLENLKRNGNILHAGGGIGLSRITQFILGSNDIREVTVFPLNRETLM